MAVDNGIEPFKEVYCFNMFGTLENPNGSISSCDNWQEVEFISLVGVGNTCEVMCNGLKSGINSMLMNCMAKVRDRRGYVGTIFSVGHEDNIGKFNQVLFIYPKGSNITSMLVQEFPGLSLK